MFAKPIRLSSLHLLFAMLLLGCASLDTDVVFFLSLHQLTDATVNSAGTRFHTIALSADGVTKANIITYPVVSSQQILKAEVAPGKNRKCGLRIFFDRQGTSRWLNASVYNRGERLAILVDSLLVGYVSLPSRPDNRGYADLPALWTRQEAQDIVAHAKKNYQSTNRK
ncbi:MAG: hypothetical protein IJJ33_03515 [Victivallales bacterium]|nr:hypothetical protein [Victivallales bacterium]